MHSIFVQYAADKTLAPKKSTLIKWAKQALQQAVKEAAEVTIRIVDVDEMTMLNTTYRHKRGPTNVLSFPFAAPKEINFVVLPLGDIVICADIVNREAIEQHKTNDMHWAHMIIHGVFHLLGYDHETEEDAEKMESLEIKTMHALGFANPYTVGEDHQ